MTTTMTIHHQPTNQQGLVAASAKISEQEALYHARLTPITDRLVGMAFPEPLEAVARLLGSRYQVRVVCMSMHFPSVSACAPELLVVE